MKFLILFFLMFNGILVYPQKSLEVYDISQKQLLLMRKYNDSDAKVRSKIIIDEIYAPYKQFWEGYLGDGDDVAEWMNGAMSKLSEFEKKDKAINGKKLIKQFRQVAKEMTKLTGYEPKGKWYVVFGPAWTDMGSLGDLRC